LVRRWFSGRQRGLGLGLVGVRGRRRYLIGPDAHLEGQGNHGIVREHRPSGTAQRSGFRRRRRVGTRGGRGVGHYLLPGGRLVGRGQRWGRARRVRSGRLRLRRVGGGPLLLGAAETEKRPPAPLLGHRALAQTNAQPPVGQGGRARTPSNGGSF